MRGPRRLVLGLALASAAVYLLAFTVPFPLFRLATRPHLTLGEATNHSAAGLALFAAALAALFLTYGWALRLMPRLSAEEARLTVLAGAALCVLVLLFAQPTLSNDLYDYLAHGRVLAVHGSDAFRVPLNAFPGDPLIAYAGWPELPSPYGLLWQLVASLVAVANLGLAGQLLLFKLVAGASLLATTVLVGRALRMAAPGLEAIGMAAFAWNPLVLLELAGNGHNDALMLWLVAAALACAAAGRRPLLTLALLMGAALVKPVALLLAAPLLVLLLARCPATCRVTLLLRALAVAGPLLALALLPVALGGASGGMAAESTLVLFSTPRLLFLAARWAAVPIAQSTVLWLASLLFLALYARGVARSRDYPSLLRESRRALLGFVLLASSEFQPWYLSWALLPAALAPRPAAWTLPASAGCLLSYVVFFWLRFWIHWDQFGVVLAASAVTGAGLLAGWLWDRQKALSCKL